MIHKTASPVTLYAATLLTLAIALPCAAQNQDPAQGIENAIAMLNNSGQAEPRTMAAMYSSAAQLHLQSGNVDRALERVKQALKICRQNSFPNVTQSTMLIAGNIIGKADDEAASRFLTEQIDAPDATEEFRKSALKILGQQLITSGNLVSALRIQNQRLKIIQKDAPGTVAEAQALLDFGRNCMTARIFDLAMPTLQKAKALSKKLNQPELVAQVSFTVGAALLGEGQATQAENVLMTQLEESPHERLLTPGIRIVLARTQVTLGKFDAARKTLARLAKDFAGTPQAAVGQAMLPIIDFAETVGKQNDNSSIDAAVQKLTDARLLAIEAKRQSLAQGSNEDMRKLFTLPDTLAVASYQMLLGQSGKAGRALKAVEEAIEVQAGGYRHAVQAGAMNSDEANVLLADQRTAVSELKQQALVSAGKVNLALEEAERFRGQAQAELMRRKLYADPEIRANDANDVNRGNTQAMTVQQMTEIASRQKTTLVFYSLVHQLDPETRSYFSIKSRWANPNAIYIWVIAPDGAVDFQQVPLNQSLFQLVDLARRGLVDGEDTRDDDADGGSARSGKALAELHQLLIKPIADRLPQSPQDHVTFVPQGVLFLVPFAALPDTNGEPLIVRHTISTVPSIEILALAERQHVVSARTNRQDVLIVGDPAMPPYQSRPDRDAQPLSQLKGARAEALYLGKLLKVQPLIGKEATETAVVARMQNARIIHLATHGLLESENLYARSYLSAIALSPSGDEDGFLTVRETMRMKLNAELAVLSACDTGRGRISGDGVIGLSRGYITAGVPAIVVSLWPVSDQATMHLMASFYQELLTGADKAAALRSAMLTTRKKFPKANAWAPFTIYGYAK